MITSRRMRWVGHVARMSESRGAYRVLVGKPEGRDHLEEDSIKMDLTEVGWGGVYWIELAQDRNRWWTVVNAVLNFRVR